MGRLLIPICIGLVLGVGLGWLQTAAIHKSYKERLLLQLATSSSSDSASPAANAPDGAKLAEPAGKETPSETTEKSAELATKAAPAKEETKAEEKSPPAETKPAVAANDGSDNSPRVEVPGGTHYKFGTMMLGEELSHDFLFRNVGKKPLELRMKSSTCKCTVGALEKSTLQPGEETLVKLTWVAKANLPDFSQSATIGTTDPLNTEVKLIVSGSIGQSIVFQPPAIMLGDISSSEITESKFNVFIYPKDLTLESLTWSDAGSLDIVDFSKITLDPKEFADHTRAERAYEVTLRIKPGMRLGPLNTKIIATTNMPPEKLDPIEIQVTGRTGGEIELIGGKSFDREKQVLNIGTVSSKEGAEIKLQMALQGPDRDKAKPEVTKIIPEESLEVIIGEPRETPTRRLYPITIRVPVGAPETSYPGSNPKNFGKIIIKPSPDSIEVPIHLRIRVEP
jgi:Protein of unknown function (DUF1573)